LVETKKRIAPHNGGAIKEIRFGGGQMKFVNSAIRMITVTGTPRSQRSPALAMIRSVVS
jgi:hypothetical protein